MKFFENTLAILSLGVLPILFAIYCISFNFDYKWGRFYFGYGSLLLFISVASIGIPYILLKSKLSFLNIVSSIAILITGVFLFTLVLNVKYKTVKDITKVLDRYNEHTIYIPRGY